MLDLPFRQADRFLRITTPLGTDALFLAGLRGREAVSEPFEFLLDLLADANADVPFDKLLGQPASVRVGLGPQPRYFHGVVARIARGRRTRTQRAYRATLVPAFALLTHRVQSRVFQGQSVPDILRQTVLAGLTVRLELGGSYPPRDYCVQYQESDFAFASRLMEEEGIWYRFDHAQDGHTLVLGDASASSPALSAPSTLIFDEEPANVARADRVTAWETAQEVRPSRISLWDYAFQQPKSPPNAASQPPDRVHAGTISHSLRLTPTQPLEVFDGPGGYAKRFDDVSPNGSPQNDVFARVYQDNARVARLRAEELAVRGLATTGSATGTHLSPGRQFTLAGHYDADGSHFLTAVTHHAALNGDFHAGGAVTGLDYGNEFQCVPLDLPFRPARKTPKPQARGVETATVVGPAGMPVFCDRYGRVKVRFRWDRADDGIHASCWVRVAQPWAGDGWGSITLPRVGQEVVVGFQHGDPDMPMILGSVYNGEQMPPFSLPENASQSGYKSKTMGDGDAKSFSGLGFEDTPGSEHVHLHSEKHLTQSAEENYFVNIGSAHHQGIGTSSTRIVGGLAGLSSAMTVGAPAASGSGSGGGGSGGSGGPFTWSPSVLGGLGKDLDIVFGWKRSELVGMSQSFILGQNLGTYVNPLGLSSLTSVLNVPTPATPILTPVQLAQNRNKLGLWATLANAKAETLIGGVVALHFGPKLDIHRGYKLAIDTNAIDAGSKKFAAVYTLATMFAALEPLLTPVLPTTGAQVAVELTVAAILSGVFGAWIALEGKLAMAKKLKDDTDAGVKAAKLVTSTLKAATTNAAFMDALKPTRILNTFVSTESQRIAAATTARIVEPPSDTPSTDLNQGGQDVYNSVMYSIYSPYTRLVSVFQAPEGDAAAKNPFIGINAVGGQAADGYKPGYVHIYGDTTGIFGGTQSYVTLSTDESDNGSVMISADDGTITLKHEVSDGPKNTLTMNPDGTTTNSTERVRLLSPPSPKSGNIWPQSRVELQGGSGTTIVHGQSVIIGNHPAINSNKTVTVRVGNTAAGTTVTVEVEQSSITLSGSKITLKSRDASVTVDPGKITLDTSGTVALNCGEFAVKAGKVTFTRG